MATLLAMIEAMPDRLAHREGTMESPDYTGHVIWALFNDPDMLTRNGQTLIGAELGKYYGLTDRGDKFPPSVRDGTGASPPVYAPYKVK